MKKLFVLILLVWATAGFASETDCDHTIDSFKCIDVVSVYDGDTIKVNIEGIHRYFGEKIGVRVSNIDSAEKWGKAPCEREMAELARRYVVHRISLAQDISRIELRKAKRDKYFRINAELWVNGRSIGNALVKNNLAVAYDGGTKEEVDWCEMKEAVPSYIKELDSEIGLE